MPKTTCVRLLKLVRQCTFCIMGPQVMLISELNFCRLSFRVQLVDISPKPSELPMGRLNIFKLYEADPVSVAKLQNDLWVGVIGLSNSVIAGSPRNVSKHGLIHKVGVVCAYTGRCKVRRGLRQFLQEGETDVGREGPTSRGKQPRSQIKVPKVR